MIQLRRSFGVHILCAVLVIAFLVAVPIMASAFGGETEPASSAGAISDPLDRLPSSPAEAHERLAEREIAWPEAEVDYGAAAIIEGVQEGVRVSIPFDTVTGSVTNGPNVKVELWRLGIKQGEVQVAVEADKSFKADLSSAGLDIQSGDEVKVTDLGGGATININCTLTAVIDFNNNRVNGIAAGNIPVETYIVSPSTYYEDVPPGAAHVHTTSQAGGAYSANFAGILDLRTGDAAYVFSINAGGHMVMNVATGSGAGLAVYPQYDDVLGYYIPGTALSVKAGSVTQNTTTLGDGFFEAWFQNFDIKDGTKVTCNMGGAREVIVRDVTATCDPGANRVEGTCPASVPVRVTMNPHGDPVIYETTSNSSGVFAVDLGGDYTASGTDVYNVTWYDTDGDAVVYEFQTFSWYLAEGYTGGDFDTWVLVQNPGPDDAKVTMSFQLVTGTAPPYSFDLAAGTRKSVHLDELPGLADAEVSTKVTSTAGNWIVAERAVYFTYEGKQGGHDSIGALTPSNDWYLAEGYTGGDFDTWVLVQNPGTETATVTLSFQLVKGTAPDHTFELPGGMRKSVHLDELTNLADAEVSTKVSANVPVVAERAVYFDYNGKKGGHDSIGVSAPATSWYLAEGYTGGDFDTWVLVQNPGTETASVTMEFQLVEGTAPAYSFELEGGMRKSVHLDELTNLADAQVSTKVTSNVPVVAERAMYFTYDGKQGGHDSIGTNAPGPKWYLAEGYTGGDFDTWVLVQNPGLETARVTLSFQLVEGTAPDYSFDLPAGKRMSVHLDELTNLTDAQVSTLVTATDQHGNPLNVVAERAMYFTYDGKQGGHASIGVPAVL
ncbi:MAG: hypothetical protein HPY75_13665 [Actinobacteria bacterium]|nr:hypothetical protein [Actinomycetota bacterium]